MKRTHVYSLLGAILLGLLVRVPGIFWGHNFPAGWVTHHVDEWTHIVNAEMLIRPGLPPRWSPHPYPKGMAAHVAVPMLGLRLLEGKSFDNLPPLRNIIVTGRVISVMYGVATILIVFLLAKHLFRDPRVAHFAVWIFALGGLHVSQSHYFLSDVPSIFWFLLGLYLLFLDLERSDKYNSLFLVIAATCFGITFGLKLNFFGIPSLALIALLRRPRFLRSIQAGVFFFAGFILVNFASYTPFDLLQTLKRGIGGSYQFNWWSNLFLYLIELPSIVSLPIVLLFLGGCYFSVRKFSRAFTLKKSLPIILIIIVPLILNILIVTFKVAHFPRHLVPFIPWISIVAAWSLIEVIDKLRLKGFYSYLVIVPLFAYLAFFIYDGEKVFIKEPRNEAAKWLIQNVPLGTEISWVYHNIPDYKHVYFPDEGRPKILIMEMHEANHYLSGMGFRNSYPKDYRYVFDGRSHERLDTFQRLFRGELDYKEVARFSEGYFMPEYRVVDNLIGNRSRNYVTELVIFMKTTELNHDDKINP